MLKNNVSLKGSSRCSWRLGSIFLIIFLIPFLSSCKKAAEEVGTEVILKKKANNPKIVKPQEIKEEKFLYAAHDKRDPFVPLVDKKGRPISVVEGGLQFKSSDLYLEGIIWDPVKPMAIINDEVLTSGDKIRGVSVVEIQKDKVILNYQDKTFELKIE